MPRPHCPREWVGTHCIGGSVGPRADLNGCGKSRPPPGFDLQTIHSVASRYTDYTVAAPVQWAIWFFNAKNIRLEEIHGQIVAMYGEIAVTKGNVRKWCWLFREGTINVHDEEWSWRTSLVTDDLKFTDRLLQCMVKSLWQRGMTGNGVGCSEKAGLMCKTKNEVGERLWSRIIWSTNIFQMCLDLWSTRLLRIG